MRRQKEGGFDALVELASRLPWWGGLVLAVIAYLFLHPMAIREVAGIAKPGEMGGFVAEQMVKSLAMIGQYLLPFAFLVGAALSAFKQSKRNKLLDQTQARGRQSALLEMSWREFEMLVGEAFRRRGYSVVETGGNGPDGGVDLVLKKGNEIHLVQCKQWKALKVGVDVVRQLYGVMASKGAARGFVVTSGRFTSDAIAFADGQNIELIEGDSLLAMIQDAKSSRSTLPAANTMPSVSESPACPRCGSPMVRRLAKQGSNAGKAFWGCTAYPKCRGTASIDA